MLLVMINISRRASGRNALWHSDIKNSEVSSHGFWLLEEKMRQNLSCEIGIIKRVKWLSHVCLLITVWFNKLYYCHLSEDFIWEEAKTLYNTFKRYTYLNLLQWFPFSTYLLTIFYLICTKLNLNSGCMYTHAFGKQHTNISPSTHPSRQQRPLDPGTGHH